MTDRSMLSFTHDPIKEMGKTACVEEFYSLIFYKRTYFF